MLWVVVVVVLQWGMALWLLVVVLVCGWAPCGQASAPTSTSTSGSGARVTVRPVRNWQLLMLRVKV